MLGYGCDRTGHEELEGKEMYSSKLPSTSALDGFRDRPHAPAALLPGKTRYKLYRRLGGSQGRSGRVRKISPPLRFVFRAVQPLASRRAGPILLCVIMLCFVKLNFMQQYPQ